MHPRLLGAVFTLAAQVLAVIDTVTVPDPPRMADFARLLAAVDKVTGWQSLDAYRHAVDQVAADVVAGDPLAAAVLDFVAAQGGAWTGTPSELHDELRHLRPEHGAWPKTPKSLSGALTRLAPALRGAGVEVTRNRTERARTITLRAADHDAHDANDAPFYVPEWIDRESNRPLDHETTSSAASAASGASCPSTPAGTLAVCPTCRLRTFDPDAGRCMAPNCTPADPLEELW
jgi:hypothetical protein